MDTNDSQNQPKSSPDSTPIPDLSSLMNSSVDSSVSQEKNTNPLNDSPPQNASSTSDTLPPSTDTPSSPPSDPPVDQPQKKKFNKGILVALLLFFLITIPLLGIFVNQQRQVADIRNQAAYPGEPCSPNGVEECTNNVLYECVNGVFVSQGACPTATPASNCTVDNPSVVNSYITISNCPGQYELRKYWSNAPPGTSHSSCVGQSANGTSQMVGNGTYTPSESCGKCVQIDVNVNGTSYGTAKYTGDCTSNPTNTPRPTNTPTRTPTQTPTATPTPNPQCGTSCSSNTNCPTNHTCQSGTCKLSVCENNPATCTPDGCNVIPTNTSSPTPTNTPVIGQCQNIKVYKDGQVVNPSTLRRNDVIVIAVVGTNATQARIKINGEPDWRMSTTTNSAGEWVFNYQIPDDGTLSFSIVAELFIAGVWM